MLNFNQAQGAIVETLEELREETIPRLNRAISAFKRLVCNLGRPISAAVDTLKSIKGAADEIRSFAADFAIEVKPPGEGPPWEIRRVKKDQGAR